MRQAQATFVRSYRGGRRACALWAWPAGWCFGLGVRRGRSGSCRCWQSLLLADLLWFAYDRSAQCDPSLYYPQIPALEEVKKATPGRIIGFDCLPALLNHICRLGDVRGDDGVEPARLIDLAKIAADPEVAQSARMQRPSG